jgi:peptide/nickel transport system permease protein
MNIYVYTLRRLAYVIPILLGVSLIIFLLFNVISTDPTILLLGKHATVRQIAELRHELGLDRPYIQQYWDVLRSSFTFDFGHSWTTRQEIARMIWDGAAVSLTLSLPAFVISTILSIMISLLVAYFRGGKLDQIVVVVCVALMSISSLAYILFGQWFFAYYLGWFEISGYEKSFPNYIPYILLPGIIWVILSIGADVRFYRTVILDEIYQDYVRTAKAKGLSDFKILFKHILKNAMIPILTNIVISIPFLILGSLLLESFFSIPGLGGITLNAINNSDFPVVKAMTILSAVAYILFSVITDILYTMVDPRVRLK